MQIHIKDTVLLSAISNWELSPTSVHVHMYRDAQFEPGAEGIALGYIRTWAAQGISLEVISTFDPTPANEFGSFGSLFGLYLVYVAIGIEVHPAKGDQRERIASQFWDYVKTNDGIIGNAKQQYIVFRDPDYVIPRCMQDQGNEDFPYADKFREVLISRTRQLGVDPTFGSTTAQAEIVSFIYQASRNAYEHGRPIELDRPLLSIRGIAIQKLLFATEEAVRRRAYSLSSLRDYFWQNWSNPANRRKAFLSVSVSDLGRGIQNTLPPLDRETPWNGLNRAIFTDASSKPLSDEIGRGKGLPYIIKAARHLKAFLIVSSAELSGFIDFSDTPKYPNSMKSLDPISEFPLKKNSGTSITFIWPTGEPGGEQLSLLNN